LIPQLYVDEYIAQITQNYNLICKNLSINLLNFTTCCCNNGICNTSTAKAICSSCNPNFYGPNCSPCFCNNEICFDGLNGNGTCMSCNPGNFGVNCNESCSCANGICASGVNGNGFCTICNVGYFGMNCDQSCLCFNGNCSYGINGTGLCFSCYPSYSGTTCNQRCIDSNCVLSCFCNDSITCSSDICDNDLTIQYQTTLTINTSFLFIQGNVDIKDSTLNLSSIQLTGKKLDYFKH